MPPHTILKFLFLFALQDLCVTATSYLLFTPGLGRKQLWLHRILSIALNTVSFALIYLSASPIPPIVCILLTALYILACTLAFVLGDIYEKRKLEKINRALLEYGPHDTEKPIR